MASSPRRAFVSFSGGKDSMLALDLALDDGMRVEGLLSMLDETGERSRSHGIPRALMEAQAAALGFTCVTATASWEEYERVFLATLRDLRERGIGEVVFGDIDLAPHREWEERVCRAAGLRAHLPLWQLSRHEVVREVLRRGYLARVVCVNARWLGESFAGRLFDEAFIADLPDGVDPCGENGEFHTFVFGGPRFSAPIEHRVAAIRRHDAKHAFGDATYYFAEIEPE
jgi:uncharacterized protein (TIGR00290 family)